MNIPRGFWGAFADSRCKTAMLVISIIVILGAVYAEMTGVASENLTTWVAFIIAFWTGRTSKAQENLLKGGK